MLDRVAAIRRLMARWNEQCERYPTMRVDIPLAQYIDVNLEHVMRYDLLADYEWH